MAIADKAVPYGLREVSVSPLAADGTEGTPVKLPIAQTFSFSEDEDFEDLRGDDAIQYSHGNGPTVSWDLESGGISLEAYKVIAGGTLTVTGTTPDVVKTYKKKGTDSRPYFLVRGRSISESGGDFHGVVYKCKATDSLEGEMADGSFWVSAASGTGYQNEDEDLYDFIHNETADPLSYS